VAQVCTRDLNILQSPARIPSHSTRYKPQTKGPNECWFPKRVSVRILLDQFLGLFVGKLRSRGSNWKRTSSSTQLSSGKLRCHVRSQTFRGECRSRSLRSRLCAEGTNYALVVGDKVYTVKTSDKTALDELNKLAWEQANVTGTASGETIPVKSGRCRQDRSRERRLLAVLRESLYNRCAR